MKISRKRKKWLKKHNQYIRERDTWCLEQTIAEYVYPRLVLFKKLNNGFPGYGDMDTPEKWDEAIDNMILAFQYMAEGDSWDDKPEFNYIDHLVSYTEELPDGTKKYKTNLTDVGEEIRQHMIEESNRRQEAIEKGLSIYAKWHGYLWW